MKVKRSVQALLHKEAGKEAVAILKQVEKMLKQGVSRAKVEKALATKLTAYMRKQIELIGERRVGMQ